MGSKLNIWHSMTETFMEKCDLAILIFYRFTENAKVIIISEKLRNA